MRIVHVYHQTVWFFIQQSNRTTRSLSVLVATVSLSRHRLGRTDVVCKHCGALHWSQERIKSSAASRPEFGMRYNHGSGAISLLPDPADLVRFLLSTNTPEGRDYWENIRF